MKKNTIAFKATVGSTTPTTRAPNGTSTPKTKIATDKKMTPDNNVPNPTRIIATGSLVVRCFKATTTAKNTKAVMNLSTTLGMNPAGNVENSPEITPVVTASKKTCDAFGNSKIPINIIVNIKSGFIPPLNPGITKYNAAPTDISRDIKTRFFVIIFSSLLNYANLFFVFSWRIL